MYYSCKSTTDYKQNYNNSSVVAFELIKQCVDTMLKISPTINTKNYVLDLSSIDSLNKRGVDSFLHNKNRTLPTTLDDSTMIFKDGNPEIFHMKQSMIIQIRSIVFQNDKAAIVRISKIKSTDEIVDATIELERYLDGYRINKVKIAK